MLYQQQQPKMSSQYDSSEYIRSEYERIIGRDMMNNLFEMPKSSKYFALLLKIVNDMRIEDEVDKIEKRRLKGKKEEKEYYWGYEFTFPQDKLLTNTNNDEIMFVKFTLKCNLNGMTQSTNFWIHDRNNRVEFNCTFMDHMGITYSLIPCDYRDYCAMYTLPTFINFIADKFEKDIVIHGGPEPPHFDDDFNGFHSVNLMWLRFQQLLDLFHK